MSAPARSDWGPGERAWLATALRLADQTQEECANELRREFEIPRASQPLITRWLSGAIKRPKCAEQLLKYCENYAPGDRPFGQTPLAKKAETVPRRRDLAGAKEETQSGRRRGTGLPDELRTLRRQLRREQQRSVRLAQEAEQLSQRLTSAVEHVDRLSGLTRVGPF